LKGKKGQPSGSSAGALIIVVGAFIVLYILFLPPSARDALLERNGTGMYDVNGSDSVNGKSMYTLLLENPGSMEYISQNYLETEHSIPAIQLFSTTEGEVLESIDSMYVKRNVFTKTNQEFKFDVSDLDNTKNILLSFNVAKYEGVLNIILNDKPVASKELEGNLPAPIELPKDYLISGENTLIFELDAIGWQFWKTNEYLLENVKITGQVTDTSTQEVETVFTISATEKDNMKEASLKFYPSCLQTAVGKMEITLNNHLVFSGVPDCDIIKPLELSTHNLKADENRLKFRSEKGSYTVESIVVKTELEKPSYPVYYFQISDEEYEDVVYSDTIIILKLRFVNDVDYKQAAIYVNGHLLHVDEHDIEWLHSLNPYIVKGNNAIELIPQSKLNIAELKVYVK
jgi:hypothetical protein